jgi:molybdopterin-containing oxidoreductase family membrane subunit
LEISARQKIIDDLLPKKFGVKGRLWVAALLIICIAGAIGYYRQLSQGLIVTNMRDYASWGIYISNFVFFVAISLVGSLVTAVLRIVNFTWSTPLTRIAEIIAISAITLAAIIIVVDMGRPDRFYNLFIHTRLQSPIIWDVVVITTYFFISLLLLYFPLLPDLRIMLKARKDSGKKGGLYAFLGSFWRETPQQSEINRRAIRILCITIVPVAVAVHTVTSWLFATTYRPGWDSTNFGAYFIAGAFLVGAGAILVAMYVFRSAYNLEKYITVDHFDKMSKIVVLFALIYLYFNINEFLVPAFKMKKTDADHLLGLFRGEYARVFWFAITTSMFLPVLILIFPSGRKPLPSFVAGVLVVVGSWFKRYVIVTPTMLHPFLPMYDVPESYKHYFPSWEEWAIAMGSLAAMLLIVALFARLFPIIPIHETIAESEEHETV